MKSNHIDWNLGLKYGFDLGHDLDPEFSRSNIEFAISEQKMVWLPWNENKHIDSTPRPQMWPSGLTFAMTLTLIFKVKYGISYISAKSGAIATKWKANISLNSRPQMWPMGLILTITLTFEFWRSNLTLTFDHTHDLDHGFSWSNFEITVFQNGRADWHCTKGVAVGHDHLVTKVRCMDLPDSDRGDFSCRHAVDSSSFLTWIYCKCL